MRLFYVRLTPAEREQLIALARRERRTPADHAAYLLGQALKANADPDGKSYGDDEVPSEV